MTNPDANLRPAKPGDTPATVEPDDARPQPQVLQQHTPSPTVAAVVATLRQIASWGYHQHDWTGACVDLRDELLALAATVENEAVPGDPDGPDCLVGLSCPMCQEIECDADCPLAPVRPHP